jgi:hypothetical protein
LIGSLTADGKRAAGTATIICLSAATAASSVMCCCTRATKAGGLLVQHSCTGTLFKQQLHHLCGRPNDQNKTTCEDVLQV